MKHEAVITRVVQETPRVKTLFFTVHGGVLPFTAGQYISVYFENSPVKAGKAYSLSSTPWDEEMSITVKEIGDYSRRLVNLKAGDSLLISNPYGFFNVRSEAPIVAMVAGVGISPVWSIVRDELRAKPKRPVRVLCSAPTVRDLVFQTALRRMSKKHAALQIDSYVTQQTVVDDGIHNRRMTVIDDTTSMERSEAMFYICGSQDYVKSLWRQLVEAGVEETRIATEIFFEAAL